MEREIIETVLACVRNDLDRYAGEKPQKGELWVLGIAEDELVKKNLAKKPSKKRTWYWSNGLSIVHFPFLSLLFKCVIFFQMETFNLHDGVKYHVSVMRPSGDVLLLSVISS